MGCFTGRCLLTTICVLQFVATVERQVFDFLGYMWAPIIGNFLHIIVIIIGFFGALQYRPRVVMVYAFCSLLWLGWNIFVICIYLEVGILSRDSPILNIGTGNKSWWLDNGIGCTITNTSWRDNTTPPETSRDIPPEEYVEGCLIQYYYVEIIQAGVQCILTLMGFCVACYVIYVFTEEDDSSQPVHDELEYIKMRYKSPARSSFRDNKMYATLTTQSTAYSTMSRGVDGPNYSDDSADRILHREQQPGQGGSPHQYQQQQHLRSQPHLGQSGVLQVPWQGNTSVPQQQTEIPPGMTELPPEGQTELPGTPIIMKVRQGGYPPPQYPQAVQQPVQQPLHNSEEGGQQHGHDPKDQSQYRYAITGQTHGVTVI